jgi:drug/metabolite transporter (DMT)-like permease
MNFMEKAQRQKGMLCILLAAVFYSIGGLCIKVIPWNALSINSARNLVAIVVVGGYLMLTRHRLRLNRFIALGALSVWGTNMFFTLANKMTTAANAIVLQFTAPIFVILLSLIFYRKRPKRGDVIACIMVMSGVICFFLDSLEMGGMLGNAVALISGLSYAGVFLLNDMPDGDSLSSVFWGELLSVVSGLPFLLQETSFTPSAIASVVIMGAFQVALAFILMCIGLRTTPPVTASLISGIEPVLNPLLVAVFYRETVGPMSLLGCVIVVVSMVIYNVWKAREDTGVKSQES